MDKTILVVDDEMAIRMILETLLGQRFDVVCLENGEQALDWLKENKLPDCMILDLSMPGIDGFEVIRRMREDRSLAQVPVIVLSSKDSTADRIRCSTLGAHEYVVKPFHPADLEARIDSLFRRRG
ncbi:MAG: response regulator transcription factor [Ignavibacteriales bacterium]|nr:response regulator transcription factor [Ignavibacteriales bacterium]